MSRIWCWQLEKIGTVPDEILYMCKLRSLFKYMGIDLLFCWIVALRINVIIINNQVLEHKKKMSNLTFIILFHLEGHQTHDFKCFLFDNSLKDDRSWLLEFLGCKLTRLLVICSLLPTYLWYSDVLPNFKTLSQTLHVALQVLNSWHTNSLVNKLTCSLENLSQ